MADLETIDAVAAQVFRTLASPEGVISLADYKRCSDILARVSRDLAVNPEAAFERMDKNGDTWIQLAEFLREVRCVSEKVGRQRIHEALKEVRDAACVFEATVAVDVEAEARRLVPTPPQTAPTSRPNSRVKPPPSRAPVPNRGMEMTLDIKPKPLHRRGSTDRVARLRARERVIGNMIDYFRSLGADYEEKLRSVQEKKDDLSAREEVTLQFNAGDPPGLEVTADHVVDKVIIGSQAERQNVQPGWLVDSVDGEEYSPALLESKQDGDSDYSVTFFGMKGTDAEAAVSDNGRENAEDSEDGSPTTATEAIDENDCGDSDEHDEDVIDQDGLPAHESIDEQGEIDNNELDNEDEEYDNDEEAGDSEGEEEEEAEDEPDEHDHAVADFALRVESSQSRDQDMHDEPRGCEQLVLHFRPGEPPGFGVSSERLVTSVVADSQAGRNNVEAGWTVDRIDGEGFVPALLHSKQFGDAEYTVTFLRTKGAAPVNRGTNDCRAIPPIGALADIDQSSNPETVSMKVESHKSKAGKKSRTKNKQKRTSKQRDISQGVSTKVSIGDGDEFSRSGLTSGAGEFDTATCLQKSGKSAVRGRLEAEGVHCAQTLEMGLAIRSAICIGKEVWCADWKGAVTTRERDDASKVTSEIEARHFVWCMAYQEPGLIWMGQDSHGISVFDAAKKEYKDVLTGGHSGGVTCLALDEILGESDSGYYPVRRGWSGSNDFTIRQWWIESWNSKVPTPQKVGAEGHVVIDLGRVRLGVRRGMAMHGHKKGIRALLRIGPLLWSGGDDGAIRLWSCADGSSTLTIGDAHEGSVLKFCIVKSHVWSAGSDGLIKEWPISGARAACLRQVAPPGADKGLYALVPLGKDVWTCGHHPNIRVISQSTMEQVHEYPAHEPYISNLLAVDRVETRILWSTSLGDRKLKVWRHTVRGNLPSFDALKAANELYESAERTSAERISKLTDEVITLRTDLEVAGEEYKVQLDSSALRFAEEKAARDSWEERAKLLENEINDLRALFKQEGVEYLLEDPNALKNFLRAGALIREFGLSNLLENPSEMRSFLQRATEIEAIFQRLGLDKCLHDRMKLQIMLERHQELAKVLQSFGFDEALADPSILVEVLSRYKNLQGAFLENGFSDMFDDPYTLKCFFKIYNRIREEFRNIGLEYLLDSPPAMHEFLEANAELASLRAKSDRLAVVEAQLAETTLSLDRAKEHIETLTSSLKEYTDICPTVDGLRVLKEEAAKYRAMKKAKQQADKDLEEMRRLLEEKEKERLDALERERQMALKYKELDVFKLDIIARELKALDGELGMIGKSLKALQIDVGRLRNFEDQQQIGPHADTMLGQCRDLRAHIRDVINKCLSETQKMHVGVAIDDPLAAGELKEGGVMAGFVVDEIQRPDFGHSKAAKLRQEDELARDKAGKDSLPFIGAATPSQTSRVAAAEDLRDDGRPASRPGSRPPNRPGNPPCRPDSRSGSMSRPA